MDIPSNAIFCDWLSMRQIAGIEDFGPLVIGGEHVFRDKHGEERGNIVYHHDEVEGSHDTKLRIRILSSLKTLSGNPSRFGREDNAVGISIEDALRLYNQIMICHGEEAWAPSCIVEFSNGKTEQRGAVCTRIDVSLLLRYGDSEKAEEFMRRFKRIKLGRYQSTSYGNTIYHKNLSRDARGLQIKAYRKGVELLEHDRKPTEYKKRLAQYCDDQGLVRLEFQLGSRYLDRHNLRTTDRMTTGNLYDIVAKKVEDIMAKTNVDQDVEGLSWQACGIYLAYREGLLKLENMAPATRAKYRKVILAKTGCDIYKEDYAGEVQKAESLKLEPEAVTAESMPEWYKHPEKANT